MKEDKHILDNRMTYIDFMAMVKIMEYDLEEQLNIMEDIVKQPKKEEIQYEVY